VITSLITQFSPFSLLGHNILNILFLISYIWWEVVGLERGPLSLVRIIEEQLEWKSSGSGQENRINDRGDPLRWPRNTLYPQKLALISLQAAVARSVISLAD
jgi:hypothetical protein